MRKQQNLKYLAPIIIFILLISGCSAGSPLLTSSASAGAEKENESFAVYTSSALQESANNTASDRLSSKQTATSAPEQEQLGSSEKPQQGQLGASEKPQQGQLGSNEKPQQEQSSSKEPMIPQDNPPPVTVNRKDAAIPTPISYTDVIKGEPIKFGVTTVNAHCSDSKWLKSIAIIRSYDELKAIYEQEVQYFTNQDHYIYFYDQRSFENKVIIMLLIHRGGSEGTYEIDKVTQKDGRMYIHMKNAEVPDSVYVGTEIANFRSFITISKEDMASVTDIVVCQQ